MCGELVYFATRYGNNMLSLVRKFHQYFFFEGAGGGGKGKQHQDIAEQNIYFTSML